MMVDGCFFSTSAPTVELFTVPVLFRRAPKAASADQAKEVSYDFAGETVNSRGETVREGETVKGEEEGRKNKRKSFLNTIGLSDMDR